MRIRSQQVNLIKSNSKKQLRKKYTESCLMHSNCLYERASTCWLSALARHEEGFCESYRYINNSTCIWTICNENPSEYLTIFICLQSRYVFSKKHLVFNTKSLAACKVQWMQRTVLILLFDLINIYSHAMETPFKITKTWFLAR